MLNAHPMIFCFRVLGLFRTLHAHTTMPNAHPTIFFPRGLGLFASFGFVSNIPRKHHDFISAKLEQYKNGGFHSKLQFIKCASFYVSYQPDL